MRELILGGQKSGKSRCAESRALRWMATAGQEAVLIATALPGDEEMRARIARHQVDRALRLPRLSTMEAPSALAEAIRNQSSPKRLVMVDCLTLWLTQLIMPLDGEPMTEPRLREEVDALVAATADAQGPLIFVSNEIGLGVAPLTSEARRFVDRLGLLHQEIAAVCDHVTLMVAGCELPVRGGPRA